MRRCFFFILVVLWSMYSIAGCAQKSNGTAEVPNLASLTVAPSLKGWELYSWPEGNTWKFSFLTGTNRVKSLSEVTAPNGTAVLICVTGLDSAKMVLNKFPQGEAVTLIGQGWLKQVWQGPYGNLQLPPQTMIDGLNAFAAQKGLTFTIAN